MGLADLICQAADSAKATPVVKPCSCPELPDLDGKVFACRVTAQTWTEFAQDIPTGRDPYAAVRFLLYALCDETGNRAFENNAMQLAKLSQLPAVVIRRWKSIAEDLNFMGDVAEDAEKKSDAEAS